MLSVDAMLDMLSPFGLPAVAPKICQLPSSMLASCQAASVVQDPLLFLVHAPSSSSRLQTSFAISHLLSLSLPQSYQIIVSRELQGRPGRHCFASSSAVATPSRTYHAVSKRSNKKMLLQQHLAALGSFILAADTTDSVQSPENLKCSPAWLPPRTKLWRPVPLSVLYLGLGTGLLSQRRNAPVTLRCGEHVWSQALGEWTDSRQV